MNRFQKLVPCDEQRLYDGYILLNTHKSCPSVEYLTFMINKNKVNLLLDDSLMTNQFYHMMNSKLKHVIHPELTINKLMVLFPV